MLSIVLAIAIGSILWSDLSLLWRVLLLAAALLEARQGFNSIRGFRTFHLERDGAGSFWLDDGRGAVPVSGARWQDFGYIAVLHYCRAGRSRSAVWWLMLMPEPQRRRLRLWMNAPATVEKAELPSILVNPVL